VESSRTVLRQDHTEQWELFGKKDPYYGVCTDLQFKRDALGEDARARFFASGDQQFNELLADAKSLAGPGFSVERALEYGCGVGRLLIPAAKQARRVVGVDVSHAMLAEARRNCEEAGLDNLDLVTPEQIVPAETGFDFVFSFAVLIHLPRRTGEEIIAKLARLLRPGGLGAFNVVLKAQPQLAGFNAVMKLPLAHNLLNLMRGREWSYPHMQMNVYNLNRIALILRRHTSDKMLVRVGQTTAGFDLCTIFFRR
jgi:2-polyprenyl-3-methyl-5-hydroxy-6-metoxy-1,4-benzoquinol methylase